MQDYTSVDMITPEKNMNLRLLGCSRNLIKICYSAFKIQSERESKLEIWDENPFSEVSNSKMLKRLPDSVKSDCPKKLDQLQFVFLVENISQKALSELHQFQLKSDLEKYFHQKAPANPKIKGFLTPPSLLKDKKVTKRWEKLQKEMIRFRETCLDGGITQDDIELCLPEGILSSEQFSLSFQTLQQFLERGMCSGTYWEIKELSWQIYQTMKDEFPSLAGKLGVKCWENRRLFCDEKLATYQNCRFKESRPHKNEFSQFWRNRDNNQLQPKPFPA
jgi:thymidylate synthase-like protein